MADEAYLGQLREKMIKVGHPQGHMIIQKAAAAAAIGASKNRAGQVVLATVAHGMQARRFGVRSKSTGAQTMDPNTGLCRQLEGPIS